MPIPKDILEVKRPKNTVVMAYGKNKDKYAVKQRIGCKRKDGRNVPVNGPTIGHIENHAYVPCKKLKRESPDLKDWANVTYCDRLFSDIIGELDGQYEHRTSLQIYCIAILRVCYPGVKDCELKEQYDTSFLSELYPGVALSRNVVSELHERLGKSIARIVAFMRKRAERIAADGDHLLVDGTLKSDESSVNSLSDFSRKARKKNSRDISVIYAFDLEKREPICSRCFPGNMLDVTGYSDFIEKNGIRKGIIVADKGFPSSAAAEHFERNPGLHFLNPVKRNSKFSVTHDMYSYTGVLRGYEGILYKKEKVSGQEKWLYSYRDQRKASREEYDYIRHNADGYSDSEFRERMKTFGTVLLECDLDLPPEDIYFAYSQRWEIEVVMRYYKQACEFDETRVHGDYSVYGSEFVSFLSSVLTYRILNDAEKRKLLEKYTYGKMMSKLKKAKKITLDRKEWNLIRINPSEEEMLADLGLVQKEETPKRRPGRPKKNSI
jgi:transposase